MLLTSACQGTSGTAVSITNTGGPNQFNSIGLAGTGNTLDFDSTHSLRGGTSISPHIVITGGGAYGVWSFTAVTTAYSRAYVYLAGAPGSNTRLISFIDSTGASLRGAIYIDTGRHIQVVNSAAVTESTSTTLIPVGAWCRVEFDCTGSATVGVLTCRIYLTPDGSTPDQTLSNTAQNTGGTIGQIWIGSSDSSTATSQTWLDDVGVTDAGPMGSSLTGTLTSAVYAASYDTTAVAGTGSWTSPASAEGVPDSSYATWTAP